MKIEDSQLSRSKDLPSENGDMNGESGKETSTSPVDTIPFSVEGIQTVVKNSHHNGRENRKRKSLENGFFLEDILRSELQRFKDENNQLRTALKEASKVNQQWRNYHDQRQGYVQKLLATIHDLQQSASLAQSGGSSSAELMTLKETVSRQQKDHREHIQLLQLQVKAHSDDWEVERNEKRTAESGRAQAESQVAILQKQLERATVMLEELENRLKYCKCFTFPSSYEDDSSSLNDSSTTCSGYLARPSPNCYENGNYSNNSRSRSSSNSGELSAPVSPSPKKKSHNYTVPQNKDVEEFINYYQVTEEEPTRGQITFAKVSPHEQRHIEEKSREIAHKPTVCETGLRNGSTSSRMGSPHRRNENLDSPNGICRKKVSSGPTEMPTSNPTHGISIYSSNDQSTETNVHQHKVTKNYYESRGARPKLLNLGNIPLEDEKQAKHRARSILASALPMSPSASIPSSPISIPVPKVTHSKMITGCHRIDSTVLPSSIKVPTCPNQSMLKSSEVQISNSLFINDRKELHTLQPKDSDLKNSSVSIKETISPIPSKNGECRFPSSENTAPGNDIRIGNGRNSKANELKAPIEKSAQSHTNGGTSCHLIADSDRKEWHCQNGDKIEHSETSAPLGLSAVAKRNKKVTNIKKSQQEKLITNYASISVMPSPTSAVSSISHGAPAASLKSLSPGFTLTTFALNANGQGIPGTMFLTSKMSKQINISPTCSSELNVADPPTVRVNSDEPLSLTDYPEPTSNGQLVNSTWVKLMDKENSHSRSSAGTPWRTARAVPSHQLNSVKRSSHEESSPNVQTQENKSTSTTNYAQISTYNPFGLSSGHLEGNCNGTVSVSQLNISSSHSSKKTSSDKSSSSSPNFNSPTVTIAPHGGIFQFPLQSRSDLMSMASRNISSAILNYEYGNKFQRPLT